MFVRERALVATMLTGVAIMLLVAALATLAREDHDEAWDGSLRVVDDPLAGFSHPRTVHFAPDGRLLIADLGTGNDDGRVVAVDLERRTQEVLMDRLPSARVTGGRFGDVTGPSGAALAPDGTVCVVIGDGPEGRGFAEMRCSDNLRVDFRASERENNPDGGEIESDPFDIVAAGNSAWYVSDAAANVLLRVGRTGRVETVAVLRNFCCLAAMYSEGIPVGLSIVLSGRGDRLLAVALLGGAVAMAMDDPKESGLVVAHVPRAIAVLADGKTALVLQYADGTANEHSTGGIIDNTKRVVVDGLDRPTGFVRLDDGRFVVAEEERGRVRIVEELK